MHGSSEEREEGGWKCDREGRWKAENHAEPWIIQMRLRCFSEITSRQRSTKDAVESAPMIHAIISCIMNTFGSRLTPAESLCSPLLAAFSDSLRAEWFP